MTRAPGWFVVDLTADGVIHSWQRVEGDGVDADHHAAALRQVPKYWSGRARAAYWTGAEWDLDRPQSGYCANSAP